MIDSIIAVAGTLAGTVSGYRLGHWGARVERAEAREQELRRERLAAVTGFAATVANHRTAMWVREDLRLAGADPAQVQAARERSHETRAAITAPLTAVTLIAPDLARWAAEAANGAYALRSAPTRQALAERRAAAITAADEFVAAARALI